MTVLRIDGVLTPTHYWPGTCQECDTTWDALLFMCQMAGHSFRDDVCTWCETTDPKAYWNAEHLASIATHVPFISEWQDLIDCFLSSDLIAISCREDTPQRLKYDIDRELNDRTFDPRHCDSVAADWVLPF